VVSPIDDDDYPPPHLPPDAKPRRIDGPYFSAPFEAAAGDEDMMQEPHPIQKIENYDPNAPINPAASPHGHLDFSVDPKLVGQRLHIRLPKSRPNIYLLTRCPHCGKEFSINAEPGREDPYDNRNSGC
jgi:hypothetical protein